MAQTILIIDDDEKLNRLLTDYLTNFNYHVLTETHPSKGIAKLKDAFPDLIILDVMLPEMDGFDVCKTIRKTHATPIIMLTARGEVMDRIVGLELGADDYLAKPFEPRELVARIQTVLRRTHSKKESIGKRIFGKLIIDIPKQKVMLDDKRIVLTTNEFVALELLTRNPGRVLNRDRILQELRGMDCDAFNRSVDITMSRLRQKLNDDPKAPVFIKTIWATGYAFIGGEDSDES
ncbi:MAG: response regulator transcription factor [Proteobacteria bacterium]|nr:response regulator transcription factor [Pseudomonadota bacterium]